MADFAISDKAAKPQQPWQLIAVLLAACLPVCAAAAQPASAQVISAPQARMSATDWTRLQPQEQQVLAPLHAQWEQLSPAQQQRLRRISARWQTASAPHRAAIEQRLLRWAAMTPEQRSTLGARFEKFSRLAPERKQDLRDAYQRFSALPPEQREALRQRFEKMTPGERAAFAAGAQTVQRNAGWQRFMGDTSADERAAVSAMWLELKPSDRHALRRHVRSMSAAERAQLRTRLLAMTPEQRTAFVAGLPRSENDPR